MTFDKILYNNTLWAVRYDGVSDNAQKTLFDQWSDPDYWRRYQADTHHAGA